MKKIKDKHLQGLIWIVFAIFLIILSINLILIISSGLTTRTIPFKLKSGKISQIRDESIEDLLRNKIVTEIDSILVTDFFKEEGTEVSSAGMNLNLEAGATDYIPIQNIVFSQIVQNRTAIEVVMQDTLTQEISRHQLNTYETLDLVKLIEITAYLFLALFTLFNSYILIRYSRSRENMLIVMFLLLLFTPSASKLLSPMTKEIWSTLISPFWGVFFYHFIVVKTKVKKNVRKAYFITSGFLIIQFIIRKLGISMGLHNMLAGFWLIKGFLLLRKQYRIGRDIQLKRLLSAFSGIGISLFSVLLFFLLLFLLLIILGVGSLAGITDFLAEDLNVTGLFIGILFLVPVLGFFVGILWFFGSFSWSLLTGTALDVKIRSTLIYSLVGFIFIMMFGLIDYSLGEILQKVFGKFMGSEFIAGIPATIGLLLFFNPVRNYAEKLVDKRLNSSDLDFLEKAETFSRDISEEGIIEGFEEYICDNLISKLEVTKVAIISLDPDLGGYKFNEVRGSDIVENSLVVDSRNILSDLELIKLPSPIKQIQDISSYTLIFRLLYDENHKWFLAFGKKKDGSNYNKKDTFALLKLIDKIKLSLKFILTYESITKGKFEKIINTKDDELKQRDQMISELKSEIQNLKDIR